MRNSALLQASDIVQPHARLHLPVAIHLACVPATQSYDRGVSFTSEHPLKPIDGMHTDVSAHSSRELRLSELFGWLRGMAQRPPLPLCHTYSAAHELLHPKLAHEVALFQAHYCVGPLLYATLTELGLLVVFVRRLC